MIRSPLDNRFRLIEHNLPFLRVKMIKWDLIWTDLDFILPLSNFSLPSKDHNDVFPNVQRRPWKWVRLLILLDLDLFPRQRVMQDIDLKAVEVNPASVSTKNYKLWIFNEDKGAFSWNRGLSNDSLPLPVAHFWKETLKDLTLSFWICNGVVIKILIILDKTLCKSLRINVKSLVWPKMMWKFWSALTSKFIGVVNMVPLEGIWDKEVLL